MNVIIKDAPTPSFKLWEDVEVGTAVQSISSPENIILKTGGDTGLRLTVTVSGSVGTIQHPGPSSKWFECEFKMSVTPAVGF